MSPQSEKLELPEDPFALMSPAGTTAETCPEPGSRRDLCLFGAPAELVWLPERQHRPAIPTPERRAFLPDRGEQIIARESLWRGPGCSLTPNRHAFSRRHLLLWATEPIREPDLRLLEAALLLEEQVGGTVLLNSMGAAASVARCHLHLVGERRSFLVALERGALSLDPADLHLDPGDAPLQELELLHLAEPFPILAVGIRGPARPRAQVVHRLLRLRTSPAVSLVSQDRCSWIFPRSRLEVPAPHFPQALGAAELWGRWCYDEQEPFQRATTQVLEEAIRLCGLPVG